MACLFLQKHGLVVYLRNPNSYTPLLGKTAQDKGARSLLLGQDMKENAAQIAQFSQSDAKAKLLFYVLSLLTCILALVEG